MQLVVIKGFHFLVELHGFDAGLLDAVLAVAVDAIFAGRWDQENGASGDVAVVGVLCLVLECYIHPEGLVAIVLLGHSEDDVVAAHGVGDNGLWLGIACR